jgi:hypothetical protein
VSSPADVRPPTLAAVRVEDIDERHLVQEVDGANFVVFIFVGSERSDTSWSVDSYLITDADLPEVLRWLTEELPTDSDADHDVGTITCWSLGLVRHPARPTTESDVHIAWIVGSDVLNTPPASRSAHEQRLADEMLTRRHHVTLL